MPFLCRTLILRYPTANYFVASLISAILSQVRNSYKCNKKIIRKTEKTYGWDFNAARKVLNKKLTVVIFT